MRKSGILLPISALPSSHGIGTFGKAAYQFADFLHASGQRCWQILPLGPTGYGDSPYQSFSTFAGNPYFIDLDLLAEQGMLTDDEIAAADLDGDAERVDYEKQYQNRYPLLRLAFTRGEETYRDQLRAFCAQNVDWLPDYALFMALKAHFGGQPFQEWDEDIKLREVAALDRYRSELAEEIRFHEFLQMLFFDQYYALKQYVNDREIEIIGDIPIYVAPDSADAWANSEVFWLDDDMNPIKVAGCPPDAFSATGQLWGNPLYDWETLERAGFKWWIDRIRQISRLYDRVRIDHFRGFEAYWAIPFGDKTAEHGEWVKGPGMALFDAVKSELGEVNIIAEDLGYLTDGVIELRDRTGYPGMKVLQFAFDSREESDYLPHNYPKNCVVYTGTHDNDTVGGWFDSAPQADVDFAMRYLDIAPRDNYIWKFIRAAWSSVADLSIAQMQDFLELSSEARMNTPSTLGGNWVWRMRQDDLTSRLCEKLRMMTKLYGRI